MKKVMKEGCSFDNMASILNHFGFRRGDGEKYNEPYGWRTGGYEIGDQGKKHFHLWFPHASYDAGGFANIVSDNGKVITERRALVQKKDTKYAAKTVFEKFEEQLKRGEKIYRITFAHDIDQKSRVGKYRFFGVYELVDMPKNTPDGYDYLLKHNRVLTEFQYESGNPHSLMEIL